MAATAVHAGEELQAVQVRGCDVLCIHFGDALSVRGLVALACTGIAKQWQAGEELQAVQVRECDVLCPLR